MLKLVKIELFYHKRMLFLYILVLPFIGLFEYSLEDGARYNILTIMFLLSYTWIVLRLKEKRPYLHLKLPLSHFEIAGTRILTILLCTIIIIIFYKLVHVIFSINGHANYPVTGKHLVGYYGFNIFSFSCFFIVHDLLYAPFRKTKMMTFLREYAKQIFIFLALFLNILGVIAMIKRPHMIGMIFEFLYLNNPLAQEKNVIIFLFISFFFALCSCFTYSTQEEYLSSSI